MKRMFDICVSVAALMLLSPIFLIISVLIWREMGAPVIFRQKRPGLNGKVFEMLKFRSMRDGTGPDGSLLPDADRLTQLGCKLRSTSLDELPGLINVLKGEMSLVGPRPLLVSYLPLYNPHQARRHNVRPGITGWAQINGRNAIGWPEKFDLDVWYVDNQSFLLDLKILFATVAKVVKRDGISATGEATMPAFSGNNSFEDQESKT